MLALNNTGMKGDASLCTSKMYVKDREIDPMRVRKTIYEKGFGGGKLQLLRNFTKKFEIHHYDGGEEIRTQGQLWC